VNHRFHLPEMNSFAAYLMVMTHLKFWKYDHFNVLEKDAKLWTTIYQMQLTSWSCYYYITIIRIQILFLF